MQYRGVNYSNRMQAENAKHGQEADMAHRIYYIEDDAGIAEGVAFFLRRKGFEVITAATVAEGCWWTGICRMAAERGCAGG